MIGLSLSYCVKDILRGKVSENEVHLVIAGTSFRTDIVFEENLSHYEGTYWAPYGMSSPWTWGQGSEIARRLWYGGKIFEPRVWNPRDENAAPNIGHGHWVMATIHGSFQSLLD